MQEISKEIACRYNIDVKGIAPYKDAYIVNTSSGKKLLRKSVLSPERIMFVHSAKEHLYRNGFINLDRYICTVDGEPCLKVEEGIFTISNMIEGRECSFDNKEDVASAARLLALMHRASKGYTPPADSVPRDELGKIPFYFQKRLDELKRLKKIAKKGKSKFDYLFLQYYDYFRDIAEDAIEKFPINKYNELVEATRNEGVFCHHDFTHNNIIFGESFTSVINFEFCCLELKIYDLANLIRRKMRKCSWNTSEAKGILKEYYAIEPFSDDELFIIKLLLQFPQKFWRVVNKYYNSKRSWSEKNYITRLQEVIGEIEGHKRFIERFEELI